MSLDRSLKSGGGLSRHRNVLTRTERIFYLAERGEFDMSGDTPTGLRKVGNRKVSTGGKTKKAEAEGGEEGEGESETTEE